MGGISSGLAMGHEALEHLRHMRGPRKMSMSVPIAGMTSAAGLLTQAAECPLGWEWTITRISWTSGVVNGMIAGDKMAVLAYTGTREPGSLVEVMQATIFDGTSAYYADGVSNNLYLKPGERLLFSLGYVSGGSIFGSPAGATSLAIRLQVEAKQIGPAAKQVDDFQREDYEDAPPEEHTAHPVGVGGEVTPHTVQTPHPLAFLGIGRDRL